MNVLVGDELIFILLYKTHLNTVLLTGYLRAILSRCNVIIIFFLLTTLKLPSLSLESETP